ncbi:helix-turn-helix transcriptional regulator [Oceanospirillum beijerinckii]
MLSVTPKIIWQWTRGKKLDFPEPIRIGTNCTRWRLSEINNWIENRR